MNEGIKNEVDRFVSNCTIKRKLLQNKGLSDGKTKKTLTVTSAALAIFSAGAITTVLIKYLGNSFLQIFAAITSGVSGIISIIITIYYSDDDTKKALEGSSKYLMIREKANRLLYKPNSTDKEIYDELEKLQTEYANLDEEYSKFLKYIYDQRDTSSTAPVPRYPRKKDRYFGTK